MTPTEAAQELLRSLALPYGAASILPYPENGQVVMHVMIDLPLPLQTKVPKSFEGYPVVVEQRRPAIAY